MKWITHNTMITLRPFSPTDRDGLFRIAADTAFFGEPIEIYLEDRNIFLDLFYRYYTDFEPHHAWVAEANGNVVGFLTGCTDTLKQQQTTRQVLTPQFFAKFLRGKYHPGPKTWRYWKNLRRSTRKKEFAEADLNVYPAHLHINVDKEWRGCGIGRRLIQVFLDQLTHEKIPGVHLGTTSENEAACKLYQAMGFKLVDARVSSLWAEYIDHPVENRAYGLLIPHPK